MSHRLRHILVWALVGVGVASVIAMTVFSARGGYLRGDGFFVVVALSLVGVGALIVLRRANRVGWMLVVAGSALPVAAWLEHYALRAHVLPDGPSTAGVWAAWVAAWVWVVPVFLLFGFLPLLFPDGRLPSRRWRPVAWGVAVFAVLSGLVGAVTPGPMAVREEAVSDNPLGIAALAPHADGIATVVDVAAVPLLLAVIVAVAVRWRRSRGVERQQMKWFLAAVGAVVIFAIVRFAVALPQPVLWVVWLAMPTAIGMAVLRYRLYDIDRIISRTVSYALLTALLVGVYVAGVVGFGSLVRSVSGGGGGDLVVAASTLAVAALFGPARRRIQAAVDRRFNRARYDAQRTVEAFSQRLRDEIDVEVLTADLARVAATSLRPAHTSVWLTANAEAGARP